MTSLITLAIFSVMILGMIAICYVGLAMGFYRSLSGESPIKRLVSSVFWPIAILICLVN